MCNGVAGKNSANIEACLVLRQAILKRDKKAGIFRLVHKFSLD
jgi:hypothetical protein